MLGLRPEDVGLLVAASDPRLAPDATEVAYAVQRVDMERNRYASRIYVARTDGSEPAIVITPDDVGAGLARWSPDGALVAYAAHSLDDDDAVSEIRVVDARGGEHRVVCRCPAEPNEI